MTAERADPRRVARETLSNGLVVARQAAPPGSASFSATLVVPAGWAHDPERSEGVALAVSQLLPSGAGRWDRRALDRHLDRLGATLARACHPESSEVTVWGPSTEWDRLLEVLAAVALRPHLAAPDLERVRRQLQERLLRESSQPASRAERELLHAIFPAGHPYRRTGGGSRTSLGRLGRADLVRFHHQHFCADGGFLVATGGPALPTLQRTVATRFGEFPARHGPDPPPVPRIRPPRTPLRTVALAGRSQVEIRVGGPSVPRASPDYPALFLANEVLGGRPILSRLFQTVRERHGLAYHASSELEAMRWGGYWVAGAGTGPERVAPTVRLLRAEVERIGSDPVPPAELDRIRESAIGELPLALETTSAAHELAVDIVYHDLPDTFLLTWPSTLRAIGPRELRRAAESGLDPGRSVSVLAGPLAAPRDGRARLRTNTHI
jgi:zinc protease